AWAERGHDGLEPVTEVADEREVAQDGVLSLRQVMQRDRHQQHDHRGSHPDEHARILYLGAASDRTRRACAPGSIPRDDEYWPVLDRSGVVGTPGDGRQDAPKRMFDRSSAMPVRIKGDGGK